MKEISQYRIKQGENIVRQPAGKMVKNDVLTRNISTVLSFQKECNDAMIIPMKTWHAVKAIYMLENKREMSVGDYVANIKASGNAGIIKDTLLMEKKMEENRQKDIPPEVSKMLEEILRTGQVKK